MRFGEGVDGGTPVPYGYGPEYGPEYRPELLDGGGPAPLGEPYGPVYDPIKLFLGEYKWWLIGGGVGVFLLAGGSILGLSLRRRRKRR